MTKLRVLLAEDHETVREGLKLISNAQPDIEVVAEAADGRVAIKLARSRASPRHRGNGHFNAQHERPESD